MVRSTDFVRSARSTVTGTVAESAFAGIVTAPGSGAKSEPLCACPLVVYVTSSGDASGTSRCTTKARAASTGWATSLHSGKTNVGVVGPELTVTAGKGAADAGPEAGRATSTVAAD